MENQKKIFVENSVSQSNEYNMLMNLSRLSVSKHLVDEHFTLVWANAYYYELIGYPKEEYERLFENRPDKFYQNDPENWKILAAKVKDAIAKGGYQFIGRMRHKSGRMMWVRLSSIFTEEMVDGHRVSYTVMADVSELQQTLLEQSITYNNIPGFIAKFRVVENGFEFVEANEKFTQLFGQSDYLLDKQAQSKNRAVLAENHAAMRRGESVNFVTQARDRDGNNAWLQVSGECMDWENNNPVYLCVYIDISELLEQRELQRQANRQLERLAFVDPVTSGRNRTSFEIDAGGAVRAALPGTYVLVWLDIQKFKVINDFFGVEMGDRVLRHCYETVEAHLENGEYVARLAADGFNLLLRTAGEKELEARLNRIAEDANNFEPFRERNYLLSFSAGIYPIDDPVLSLVKIQDRANIARKKSGGSEEHCLCTCLFYSEQDRLRSLREKEMENRMHDALGRDEFVVYLQPKQSLKKAAIGGAEALVRWRAPEGLIPPNDFIPLFEQNGFIVDLDLHVFEKVCAMLRKWLDNGVTPVPVSVNMSRVHLADPQFLERYETIRRAYDVPPELLEIELTESLVFENPHLLVQFIERIRAHGYHCSIDDFGSGYSSLNLLKDMNVNVLKLDRVFFASQEADNARERTVIVSVIDLAKKLSMGTVAEGVETTRQVEFLQQAGCDMVQGYVFSRPVPLAEFEQMAFGREIAA
ncbi:diguanylate cyclase (GGDEF) domain-containing protein [Desulfovibrio sp. 3_1_syn3]|uniref:sensor domain-containing protein n=1 Tax=Desulfovibrio sp. 3_1_syn3 TaxID=457398 RepID=UPI0001E12BE9|nr:EAL domain-containing protein [Desulfovibrio sp. 3_1_syn3]EFL85490.1 diguanylate cyclase (GGDEF) domain-containing protein [Desulfovibrio sp. 3_1_syn3]